MNNVRIARTTELDQCESERSEEIEKGQKEDTKGQ